MVRYTVLLSALLVLPAFPAQVITATQPLRSILHVRYLRVIAGKRLVGVFPMLPIAASRQVVLAIMRHRGPAGGV